MTEIQHHLTEDLIAAYAAGTLGHAFSVHGLTGNLGWAAAPVFLAGISAPPVSCPLRPRGETGLRFSGFVL